MPRIRTVKPEIHDDEAVGELSDSAFRLFIGLITQADDAGRLKGDPRYLAAKIWPYRPEVIDQVDGWLQELSAANLIHRYSHSDRPFICLPSWSEHQRVDNAGKSRIPGPDEADRKVSPRNSASRGGSPLDQGRDQGEDQGSGSGRAREEIPEKFQAAIQELDHIAHNRNVTLNALAAVRACKEHEDRDLLREARECRHKYVDGDAKTRRVTDVAGLWRKWLQNAPPAGAGKPSAKRSKTKDRSKYSRVEAAA